MNTQIKIWIGLAKVSNIPGQNLLNGAKGAYVNILAMASSSSDFKDKVKKSVIDLGLNLLHIEDVELFSERSKNYEITESIKNLAKEVSETKELRFGNFHTFDD
jgi:hypothetical protein